MNNQKKHPKTDFFNVLGSANVDSLIERVLQIPESVWDHENSNKPNKFVALDATRHIPFRFIKGFDNVFESEDKPLWSEWRDDLLSFMEPAAKTLGYTDYSFPRVMLARMTAGGKILPHVDSKASYFIHKIHIPLTTNPQTIFKVGDQTMHMKVGQIIEVNNKRHHSVINDGDTERIHLIFECYNMDDYGKEL